MSPRPQRREAATATLRRSRLRRLAPPPTTLATFGSPTTKGETTVGSSTHCPLMPLAAIELGVVDHVLTPARIAERLLRGGGG